MQYQQHEKPVISNRMSESVGKYSYTNGEASKQQQSFVQTLYVKPGEHKARKYPFVLSKKVKLLRRCASDWMFGPNIGGFPFFFFFSILFSSQSNKINSFFLHNPSPLFSVKPLWIQHGYYHSMSIFLTKKDVFPSLGKQECVVIRPWASTRFSKE